MKLRTKLGLTILAAIGYFAVTNYSGCNAAYEQKDSKITEITVSQLSDAYRRFNEDLFYGGLPTKNIKIVPTYLPTAMGELSGEDGQWVIRIDKESNPIQRQAEMTLIHEMCHLSDKINGENEGFDGHSYAWETCMENIAARGQFKDIW